MEKETTFYGFIPKLIKDVWNSMKSLFSADIGEEGIDDKLNLNVFSSLDQKTIKDALSEVARDEKDLAKITEKPLKGKKDFKVPENELAKKEQEEQVTRPKTREENQRT